MDILICDDEPLVVESLTRIVTQLRHRAVASLRLGQKSHEYVEQFEAHVFLLNTHILNNDGFT